MAAMCPDQGSANELGEEKVSARLEALQGSRKQHGSSTLTATTRVSVGYYSTYILGTNKHTWTNN